MTAPVRTREEETYAPLDTLKPFCADLCGWADDPLRHDYWWLPEWRRTWPDAAVYMAPRLLEQAGGRIDFPTSPLDGTGGYPWDDEIATLPVASGFMTEIVFFYRPSATLILTDLIENFEAARIPSRLMRMLVRLGGVAHPHGGMPRDLRLTFARHRAECGGGTDAGLGAGADPAGEWGVV